MYSILREPYLNKEIRVHLLSIRVGHLVMREIMSVGYLVLWDV